jgi:hypothetical protein
VAIRACCSSTGVIFQLALQSDNLSFWLALCFWCRSPWSTGRAVATYDQLNPYLNPYATPTTPQPTQDGGPEPSPLGAAAMYGDADQGPAASPALPPGRDAPAYRPSLVSWVTAYRLLLADNSSCQILEGFNQIQGGWEIGRYP